MRVLIIAPSWARTPPDGHGPGEQNAAYLAAELVRRGVEVTVFATADSSPAETLAWVFDGPGTEPENREAIHVDAALRLAETQPFDIIHSNESNIGLLKVGLSRVPSLTRMNWNGDDHLREAFGRLPEPQRRRTAVSANSHTVARLTSYLSHRQVVHNGLDVSTFPFSDTHRGPLLFLGRMIPGKGPDLAIDIAMAAARSLILAGPMVDPEFFEQRIRPRLDPPRIDYVGHADSVEKRELLVGASGLLMPYRDPEPFGHVLLEAMACGTPVVATDRGSPAEVLDVGVTGFLVDDVPGAVQAIGRLDTLRPEVCRAWVADRFSIDRMVDGYMTIYRDLLASSSI